MRNQNRRKQEEDDEADLLRIQTQILNPRSNSRLNSDILLKSFDQLQLQQRGNQLLQLNEEGERFSIAIDMRAMPEMSDTLKH